MFFDAFIVRMVIIPSLLTLLGRWAWWLPAWLDHVLARRPAGQATAVGGRRAASSDAPDLELWI